MDCFLFDEFKLHTKIGFFESRRKTVVFIINVLMNTEKFFVEYCKCTDKSTCLPCEIAETYNEKLTYQIYENCFNLDLLLKVKQNLCIQLISLYDAHNHFLRKILSEDYVFHEEKCIFTGASINISVKEACCESEKKKTDEILNQKLIIPVNNFLKGAVFSVFS